jgi:acetyltransferase
MKIHPLDARAAAELRPQLVDLLLDAVAHGASMGFADALAPREAERYWRSVELGLVDRRRVLLAASHEGRLVGTVQLEVYPRPNGCDGAELQKMMVHSRARRRGIGSVLLRAAEAETRALGRTLLFLDTEAGSGAEHLYHGLGYTRVAEVRANAAGPTAVYYKSLLMPELA